MASEMDISPTASSATVEDGLTTRDDQSMSGLSQDDLDAAQALEDLRRGESILEHGILRLLTTHRLPEVAPVGWHIEGRTCLYSQQKLRPA